MNTKTHACSQLYHTNKCMCFREREKQSEGGMTSASCPYSLQQTQIGHVTLERHHHPLPILVLFLPPSSLHPVREEGDLSLHLKEGGSV